MPNIGRWAIATCALALGGCSTLNGAPEPLFTAAKADVMLQRYQPDEVIGKVEALDGEQDRRIYRDRVVGAYLIAIDARYKDFTRELSRTKKGGSVAFDALSLGLSGLASVWGSAATKLAAGATVAGGTRASLDRELYAEKALPTILSLMDSNRLAVRADIQRGLSLPEAAYSIQAAFADLSRYEDAASIDTAFVQAATAAGERAQDIAYDYSNAVTLCDVSEDVARGRIAIMQKLERLRDGAVAFDKAGNTASAAANRAKIQTAAQIAGNGGAPLTANANDTKMQVREIRGFLDKVCSPTSLKGFRDNLDSAQILD